MSYEIGTFAITAIAVILSGLIAGQMLAIALANHAARELSETAWTLRFQAENRLFTKTMPPSLLLPLLGLTCSAFLTLSMQRVMFSAAGALELVVLAITVRANIPINTQVQLWQAGSAPPAWMTIRDRWLRYHWMRTIVGVCSFTCAAIGLGIHPWAFDRFTQHHRMAADQRLERGVLQCGEKSGAANSLNDRSLSAFVEIDDGADLLDGAIRTPLV